MPIIGSKRTLSGTKTCPVGPDMKLCLALCPAALQPPSRTCICHKYRLDHCSSILEGFPLAQTARLDPALCCAARLIGRIPKYGSVSAYMRDTLHWLPIAQRIHYRIDVLVWRCLLDSAPGYLCELCRPLYLVYLDAEPFVPLLPASYWCLVLKLQLSIAHSPLLAPPPGMDSPWKSVSCLRIMKLRFAGCLRLICIAVAGLGAPLSRFLEGAPYKFLNE